MAEYLIQGETLTAIGDAIRAQTGTTELITPEDMPSHIPLPEEKTVELDFSAGAVEVTPSGSKLLTKVIIPVPANLTPENIAKDVDIAGVVGTMEACGDTAYDFDTSDENLKYFNYYIDGTNKQIMITSVRYEQIYADKGSYDVVVPDTIGGYHVVLGG